MIIVLGVVFVVATIVAMVCYYAIVLNDSDLAIWIFFGCFAVMALCLLGLCAVAVLPLL